MNYEKKLISIFKIFTEKILLPQIRRTQGSLQQWAKFSAMLSNDLLNYNQLQAYVEHLPDYTSLPVLEKKRSQNIGKKKEQPHFVYIEEADTNHKNGFRQNRSFGGERPKNVSFNARSFDQEESKQYKSQMKEVTYVKEQPFKKGTMNNNNPNTMPASNNPVLASLDRLYRSLLQNQPKIQNLSAFPEFTIIQ